MNKVVILQPSYLPWIGYFDQIYKSDIFAFFDDVQYTRRDWRNRNYIKDISGKKRLLTVPVNTKGQFHGKVKDITINDSADWRKQHLWLIKESYRKAPYFTPVYSLLEDMLSQRYTYLADLTIAMTRRISDYLGITTTTFLRTSDISATYTDSTDHLVKLCTALNATHYLTGDSAKNYMKEEEFTGKNITVEYHGYRHPAYPQLGEGFIPYISIVDLLFNEGPRSLGILCDKREVEN